MLNHQFLMSIAPWLQVTKEYQAEGYDYKIVIETVDVKLKESCGCYIEVRGACFYKRYCRATKVHIATGKILGVGVGSHSARGRAEEIALFRLFKIKNEGHLNQCIPFMSKCEDMLDYIKTPVISCDLHINKID